MEVDRLLDPVSESAPSGAELRNDARFHAIERLLEPASKANRFTPDGSINESAPAVEWQQILDDSLALAEDGRDLRLLVFVVRALAQIEGYPGLARGLTLLTDTVDRYWDSLHPAMRDRPDPAMAALPRTNAIKQLENSDNGLLGDLRASIAFTKRGLGAVWGLQLAAAALTDFEVLARAPSGLSKQEQDAIVSAHGQTVNRVAAACKALAAEETDVARGLVEGIKASEAAITALTAKYTEKAGLADGLGLQLPDLSEFLKHARTPLERALAETGGADAPASGGEPAANGPLPAGAEMPAAGTASGTAAVSGPGRLASRSDVETALDKIVEYYERNEPASPMPYLLRRVRRMVKMDFMELMEEVAPGGVKDFSALAGLKPGGKDEKK